MIESYINEYSELKHVGDNPNIEKTYLAFLSENTPFVIDANRHVIWCDDAKEVGVICYSNEIALVNKSYLNSSSNKITLKQCKNSRSNFAAYLQRSRDGNVWYLRDKTDAGNSAQPAAVSIVLAKAADGWVAVSENVMATKSEYVNISTGVPTNTSALYTIQKTPTLNGGTFPELYSVFYAGNFEKTSTVISRDGVLYRVVSVNNDHGKPSFAFPVSETVWGV